MPRPFWVQQLAEAAYDYPGEGPFSLELQDGAGTPLFIRRFDRRLIDEHHAPDAFREIVPFPAAAQRIVFRYQGDVVQVVSRSPNPPTVTVLSPNGGETWDGTGPFNVTWRAEDADCDTLVARVSYSTDGGSTWQPLAVNLRGSRYAVDASDLPGSEVALIQVRVSDGVNMVSDVSDATFRVTRKAPLATLLGPSEGANLLPGQPVVLQGLGTDPEDGPLPDAALTWSSSRDGLLGTGTGLAVARLSPGTHQITLTARDRDGQSSSTSVSVFVGYQIYLPVITR